MPCSDATTGYDQFRDRKESEKLVPSSVRYVCKSTARLNCSGSTLAVWQMFPYAGRHVRGEALGCTAQVGSACDAAVNPCMDHLPWRENQTLPVLFLRYSTETEPHRASVCDRTAFLRPAEHKGLCHVCVIGVLGAAIGSMLRARHPALPSMRWADSSPPLHRYPLHHHLATELV